jgi:hypothetical protein
VRPQPVGPLNLSLYLAILWRDCRSLIALDDANITPAHIAASLRDAADLLDSVATKHRDAELVACRCLVMVSVAGRL